MHTFKLLVIKLTDLESWNLHWVANSTKATTLVIYYIFPSEQLSTYLIQYIIWGRKFSLFSWIFANHKCFTIKTFLLKTLIKYIATPHFCYVKSWQIATPVHDNCMVNLFVNSPLWWVQFQTSYISSLQVGVAMDPLFAYWCRPNVVVQLG